MIFDQWYHTNDAIEAASTKEVEAGLVGGHCIAVDPTIFHKAEALSFQS